MALMSLSAEWIVNQPEKTEIVRRLFTAGRLNNLAPDDILPNIKANSAQIISEVKSRQERLSKNITQKNWDNMTLAQLVSIIKGNNGNYQDLEKLDEPSIWYSGQSPLIGMDSIIALYQNKHAYNFFKHFTTQYFPYRTYYKTWDMVQAQKDEIDYLIIRHYEIFGVKLATTNPKLFSSVDAPPQYGKVDLPPAPLSKEIVKSMIPKQTTPAVEEDPSGLHPDVKWMVLGVMGMGLLFAIIFLRRK
jgi:hypothetical protein